MEILGYSERGAINAIFFEIAYNMKAQEAFEALLVSTLPDISNGESRKDFKIDSILIEQSFSEFGDADVVLLCQCGKRKISIFVEAKVKHDQSSKWNIKKQLEIFCLGTSDQVDSSNLFAQLYHKMRMMGGLKRFGLEQFKNEEIGFPAWSSITKRKIGSNQIVLKAIKRLADYMDISYYLAIIPEKDLKEDVFKKDEMQKEFIKCGIKDWQTNMFCMLTWQEIHRLCEENHLEYPLKVLKFNEGQIY